MRKLDHARNNCAAALRPYYPDLDLLADYLEDGHYRAYWQNRAGGMLESICDNIFDPKANIEIYLLSYVQPQNTRFSGLAIAH